MSWAGGNECRGIRRASRGYGVGGERAGGPPRYPSQWHFNDCQISSPVQTHLLSLYMNESIRGSHHPAHGRALSHIHDRGTIWKWIHDSRTARWERWIHISGWEDGLLFDLSTLSTLSDFETEKVPATVSHNLKQHFIPCFQHQLLK